MKMLQSLRDYLTPYAHSHLRNEPLCTCGDSNHVRILFFRITRSTGGRKNSIQRKFGATDH